MLSNDIPFTDMPVGESIDFTELANQYNRLLGEREHYRNALVSIASSDFRGPEPREIRAAKVALWQIDPDWRP